MKEWLSVTLPAFSSVLMMFSNTFLFHRACSLKNGFFLYKVKKNIYNESVSIVVDNQLLFTYTCF